MIEHFRKKVPNGMWWMRIRIGNLEITFPIFKYKLKNENK